MAAALRWLCAAALMSVARSGHVCCGIGKCNEATKAVGYCFGQTSEWSCHSHAVGDRPCTWVTRKGNSKCTKAKKCLPMTEATPAKHKKHNRAETDKAKKPLQSRASSEPGSAAERPAAMRVIGKIVCTITNASSRNANREVRPTSPRKSHTTRSTDGLTLVCTALESPRAHRRGAVIDRVARQALPLAAPPGRDHSNHRGLSHPALARL